jgi:hypothetical protein
MHPVSSAGHITAIRARPSCPLRIGEKIVIIVMIVILEVETCCRTIDVLMKLGT